MKLSIYTHIDFSISEASPPLYKMPLTKSITKGSAPATPTVGGEGGATVLHIVVVEVASAAVSLQAVVCCPRSRSRLLSVQLQRLSCVTCTISNFRMISSHGVE